MVDRDLVTRTLTTILQSIQSMCGLDCPVITDATCPIKELDKFDSKMWPVATSLLAGTLGIVIPNDVNIFRKPGSTQPLTLAQTVTLVCELSLAHSTARGADSSVA